MDSRDNNLVLFASQRKSHARLSLFLLECNVEQLLHKLLWTDIPPPLYFTVLLVCFFRGGSVCLSWLLEPSLSIKKDRPYFLLFVLDFMWRIPWVCRVIHWYCNTKKMSAVVYIIRPSVFISFYLFLFSLWGICFVVLDWLVLLFLWLLFGNKVLWKNSGVCASERAAFGNKTWSRLKLLSNINLLLLIKMHVALQIYLTSF